VVTGRIIFQRAARNLDWQPVQEFLLRAERLLRLAKRLDQRLLRAVTTVRRATESERRVLYRAAHGLGLRQVQSFLGDLESLLRSVTARDEGAFSVTTTDHPPRGSGWMSERQSTCLSLLDRHMKHAADAKRTARKILAELMHQFRFLPEAGLKDPEDWVEKRLERLGPKTRWPLLMSYHWYHLLHEESKALCTRACELRRVASAHSTRGSEEADRFFLSRPVRFVKARVGKSSRRGRGSSSRPRRGKTKSRTRKTVRRVRTNP
jgi:hypothetical protein